MQTEVELLVLELRKFFSMGAFPTWLNITKEIIVSYNNSV